MNRKTGLFSLTVLIGLSFTFIALALSAQARPLSELHVCASGCPYSSIQPAVDAANAGDLIKIATGVYTEATPLAQMVYITKSLTLRGGYNPPDWTMSNPVLYTTTLDAQGQGRVMYIDGSGITGSITVTLDGLHLTGGHWTGGEDIVMNPEEAWYNVAAGGGLRVQSANLQVLNTTIVNNQTRNGLGSGLFQWYGTLTMSNSVVQSNAADGSNGSSQPSGGGLCLFQVTANISNSAVLSNTTVIGSPYYSLAEVSGGGLYLLRSTATIQHTLFRGNRVNTSTSSATSMGGGLSARRGNLTLLNATFEANVAAQNNVAGGQGGGLYLAQNNAVVISGTLFTNNVAGTTYGQGGGLYASGAMNIAGNTFQGNTACPGSSYCNGGGAYLSGGVIVFQNNTMISNTAGTSGGGVYLYNNSNYLTSYTISAIGNLFQGNTVSGGVGVGNGGGLYIYGSPINLVRNTIQDNNAGACGGGLVQSGLSSSTGYSPADLQDGNIIRRNIARYGGGMCIAGGYVGTAYQNQVVLDNQASVSGSGIYFDHGGTYAGTTLNLRHFTIGRNTGDGTAVYVNQGAAAFVNTIIYSQTVGVQNVSSRTPSFDHTLRYQVMTPTLGTVSDVFAISGDPAFTSDGYHLTHSSAAIDAGISTPVNDDVDGNVRPQGQSPDLGAVESPYTRGIAPGVQASKQAGTPHWVMQWDPIGNASSMILQQDYLIPFSYGGPITSPAISSFSVQDNFPTALQMSRQAATPAMSFALNGSQLTWRSTAPFQADSSGWIGMVGQSSTVQPGVNLNNSATLVYSFTTGQTNTIPMQAGSQVPPRPLLPPLLSSPLNGEMCLDEQGRLTASGLTHAGMTVNLYEDNSLKASTTADASGAFTVTWTSTLTSTTPSNSVNLYTTACDPAQPGNCSAPSRTVHLDYPQAFWCPQRSYWEGNAYGQHFVFHFVNDQGRYATNGFELPGVSGFVNTQLHLYSCCDRDTNPFTVIADGTSYTTPTEHIGRMWTFNIGAAHDVTVESQCQVGGNGHGRVLIDPDGFVFDVTKGGHYDTQTGMFSPTQSIAGITVTAYVSVPEWGGWMPWPAQLYNNQINPQVTGNSGYFAFFTPPGTYYLQAMGAGGYQAWRSPVIEVITKVVHANMPLTPWTSNSVSQVTLTPSGPNPPVITVATNSSVEWLSSLRASPTITDLVSLTDNPVLRLLSARNPFTDTLGFDGGMLTPGQIYRRQFTQRGTYAYSDGMGHIGQVVVIGRVYLPIVLKNH